VPTAYSAVVIPVSAAAQMARQRIVSERFIESPCYSLRSEGTQPGQSRLDTHRGHRLQPPPGSVAHLWTVGRSALPLWMTTVLASPRELWRPGHRLQVTVTGTTSPNAPS